MITGKQIYWIGGSSCSGKSSSAKRIADEFDMTLFKTDEYAFGKFMFGIKEEEKYLAIVKYRNGLMEGMDAFARKQTANVFSDFLKYCYEVFPLIYNEINNLPNEKPILVEGAHILPDLTYKMTDIKKTIYLVSTKSQQERIWLMEMKSEIPGGHPAEVENYSKSENKETILKARIELHERIALHINEKAIENNQKVIIVNEQTTKNYVQSEIIKYFELNKENWKA